MMRRFRWLASLLVRGRDAQFIRHDLEEMYERDRARGMSVSRADARYVRKLIASAASLVNETRRNMRNAFTSDLRQAARALIRDRGFTAVSAGTLAASLALSVTVAVLVNAYLVRGLPYPDSHRLFNVQYGRPDAAFPVGIDKLDWRTLGDVVDLSIAWDLDNFTLRGSDHPELVQGTWVTPGYVDGFGIRAALGRGFEPADFEAGRPMVAMISDRLWRSRFNGDRAIIGRTFEAYVNDRPNEVEAFTVVGVLPASHWHVNTFTEVLAPLRAPAYPYIVRVRDGVPPGVAADRIGALVRSGATVPADFRVELRSMNSSYVEQIRPLLFAVATATGLVLLIACANVGVLLTLRATRRRREMAVRQALGATAGQITRVSAAEPLLLGAAATAAGLGLAWATIRAVAPRLDHYLGRPAPGGMTTLGIDPVTVLLTIGVGLLTVAIASIVPIWVTRRTPVALAMAGGQKGATDGPGQRHARTLLIAIEVAACLTLLVGAGLTIQSAVGMLRVDMGLDANNVVVGRFSLRQRAYPEATDRAGFYERVMARSGEINGAQGIAFTNSWPLQQSLTRDVGGGDSTGPFPTRAGIVGVSPDYFTVLRVPLHEGRLFTAADRIGSERVTLVSRTLATRLWGSTRAVGQQLRIAPAANSPPSARPLTLTVVGVVGDIRHTHTDDDLADAYMPILQSPSPGVFVYLRVSDAASAGRDLGRLLGSIDGDVAFGAARSLAEILDLQRAGARLLASLLVVFAVFAASLALVGIYAVVAYTVKQREREIAVRLAMGADRRRITRMFLQQGALVLGAGLVLGIGGALALGRVLRAQLFRIEPTDPAVLAGMTVAFALCGLVAIAWPARAAASLDSATTLKE